MNKLVSKNSILRFKLGRKIVKAQYGAKQKNDRAANKHTGYFFDARDVESNNMIMDLLRAGYRVINGEWLSPEELKEYYAKKRLKLLNNSKTNNTSAETLKNVETLKNTNVSKNRNNNLLNSSSNSNRGLTFSLAFNQARNSGQKEFIWNGGRYNTMTASEKKTGATLFLNGRWINPNIKFVAPTPTDMTTLEVEELNRKAKPIGNLEGASFAKQGIKLIPRKKLNFR